MLDEWRVNSLFCAGAFVRTHPDKIDYREENERERLEPMAVLLTGGTGYIGSVAVEVLLAAGERVVVLDDLFRGHRAALPEGVPLHEGNVGDRSLLRHLLSSYDLTPVSILPL